MTTNELSKYLLQNMNDVRSFLVKVLKHSEIDEKHVLKGLSSNERHLVYRSMGNGISFTKIKVDDGAAIEFFKTVEVHSDDEDSITSMGDVSDTNTCAESDSSSSDLNTDSEIDTSINFESRLDKHLRKVYHKIDMERVELKALLYCVIGIGLININIMLHR